MFSCVPRIVRSISRVFEIKNCCHLVVYIDSVKSTSAIFLLRRTILDKDSLEGSFSPAAIEIELVECWITEEVTSSVLVDRNLIAPIVFAASTEAVSG